MIIMNLKLDNVLSFHNFNVNFSYPVKLRKSLINNECIKGYPNFRYKKLNIFIGSNATGKTSLIKCIWSILFFLTRKEKDIILNIANKDALIEMDFVDSNRLYRIKIWVHNKDQILMSYKDVLLDLKSSYENSIEKLNIQEDVYEDYLTCLNKLNINTSCNVVLPATEQSFDEINFATKEDEEYLFILNQILKTLDPSIKNVKKSLDADDAYVIEHENSNKIIVQEKNKLSSIPYLSSGTKYAFNITNIMYSIKKHLNGIYLIDEQFSYVDSDIEVAILSTMVSMLGDNEQIFFTTHNSNILSLNFPFHSFYFMKKIYKNNQPNIEIYCASETENRNNVSPKTILDNDVFATAPDVNKIFELGE